MIRAKKYDVLRIREDADTHRTVFDVMVIPVALLKSLLRYNEPLLTESYNSLTDYEKGIVDTLKKQHELLSINIGK